MKLATFALSAALAFSLPAYAKVFPTPSKHDSRFQTVDYTTDVIELRLKIGRFTEIEFAKDETKIDFLMGDREAWTIKIIGNTFYLKPKAAFADTNLKIITNKRTYWFDLVMTEDKKDGGKKKPVAYRLDFRYPYEPPPPPVQAPVDLAAIMVQKEAAMQREIDDRLAGSPSDTPKSFRPVEPKPLNGDYSLIGPDELMPTSVFDNGEQTAITFAPQNPMPIIFVKEADGSESRVNFHVENDMLIVHRIARKFILRRGSMAACLINGNFRPFEGDNSSNTISSDVVREVRGAK